MTPRYDWTPASEPPNNSRKILLMLSTGDWHKGLHTLTPAAWWIDRFPLPIDNVTHWRDIEPPEEA